MFRSRFLFVAGVLLSSLKIYAQSDLTISIDLSRPGKPVNNYLTCACLEDVNHEVYGGIWSQMIFGESFQEPGAAVSGMWRSFERGNPVANASLETHDIFTGTQSQRISFTSGDGEFGIENRGLNRQGISVVAGKGYHGCLQLRGNAPTMAIVSLASGEGSRVYASAIIPIADRHWHRYEFSLTPDTSDPAARFEIKLNSPGSLVAGYVFLQPGEWGRFKGLPVRRDVVEALQDEGIAGMRYGGSMVNSPEYRWKKMIGPPDHRPPYLGHWYPQSSNGWGIIDFLNLCEAMKIPGVPVFNIDETPGDMADFIDYTRAPTDGRRITDGHAAPYAIRHLELGNEERIDENYYSKFEAIARAIWKKDPHMILTVGDFSYSDPIVDPNHLTGAASKITSMNAHRKILALAKQYDAEVWFDVHVFTDQLPASPTMIALPTYIDAIDTVADGAKHHVVVFELNADNPSQKRALANAQAILRMEKDGRVAFVSSANCLQVEGQNNNGWNQGLLFLNPHQVWLQPPGYVMQMLQRNYQPALVNCAITGNPNPLEAAATLSEDRKTLVLQVLNTGDKPIAAAIKCEGADASDGSIQTLTGDPSAFNTADHPDQVKPTSRTCSSKPIFPANSFSICRWQR